MLRATPTSRPSAVDLVVEANSYWSYPAMAQSRAVRTASRRKRRRSARIASVWPVVRSARRALRALLVAPLGVRVLVGAVVVLAVWLAVNWLYRVARKPAEVVVSGEGARP